MFFCKNRETTSGPKVNDTPRSFSDQPVMSLSDPTIEGHTAVLHHSNRGEPDATETFRI